MALNTKMKKAGIENEQNIFQQALGDTWDFALGVQSRLAQSKRETTCRNKATPKNKKRATNVQTRNI